MVWTRKPRLNSAVATVAVLMVLSLLRVASLRLLIILSMKLFWHARLHFRHSGMRLRSAIADLRRRPGIHTPDRGYGFRARSLHSRPGTTKIMTPRTATLIGLTAILM